MEQDDLQKKFPSGSNLVKVVSKKLEKWTKLQKEIADYKNIASDVLNHPNVSNLSIPDVLLLVLHEFLKYKNFSVIKEFHEYSFDSGTNIFSYTVVVKYFKEIESNIIMLRRPAQHGRHRKDGCMSVFEDNMPTYIEANREQDTLRLIRIFLEMKTLFSWHWKYLNEAETPMIDSSMDSPLDREIERFSGLDLAE